MAKAHILGLSFAVGRYVKRNGCAWRDEGQIGKPFFRVSD